MSTISEDVTRALEEHGNAVLLLPTPRWEKQIAAHVQAFWAEVMIPMIRAADVVETSVSSQSRGRSKAPSLQELLGVPDSTDFAFRWLEAVNSGRVGESNVFIALTASAMNSSVAIRQAISVGYFDRLSKHFSQSARFAISKCLCESELAFGVGPPPFGSAYIVARLR